VVLKKARFAVGTAPDKVISSWWFLSVNHSCVYIGARPLGGVVKATLHASRQCHVRFGTTNDLGQIANHKATSWERKVTPDLGIFHAVTIVFPTDLLKGKMPAPQGGADHILLEPAPNGSAVEFGVFYSRQHPDDLATKFEKHGLPLYWAALENGEFLSVVARTAPFDPVTVGPLAGLLDTENPIATLPNPIWSIPETELAQQKNLSAVVWNDPGDAGFLVLVQVSGMSLG
jgi:hypothetical protein